VGALMAYDPHKALKFLQESEQAYKPVKENYGFSYFFTKIKIVDALYSIYILDNAPQFRTKAVQQALDLEVEMMSYNGYGKSDLATLLHNTRARFDLVQPEQIPKMQIINKIQLEEAQIISEKDRLPVHQKLVTEIEKQFIASGRTDMNLKYLLAGARTYLSWLWLYKKEYARSEQVAREATQLFPEQSWYRISLAYSLLFQNKLEEAVESLMQIKDTFAPATGERLKNIILRDFDLLEKEGITHPDITKVKASLKEGN
jgi:tetratricopeptide (TPR) repeat protein